MYFCNILVTMEDVEKLLLDFDSEFYAYCLLLVSNESVASELHACAKSVVVGRAADNKLAFIDKDNAKGYMCSVINNVFVSGKY